MHFKAADLNISRYGLHNQTLFAWTHNINAGSITASHYEKALRGTQTPAIVHCNYAKALHDLGRISGDLGLYKKSSRHFMIAAKINPNYYSVFLSWGHALSDLARKTGSAKAYLAAFDKYHRAAEIQPADIAAHHSWYYALLELAKKSEEPRKAALTEQAEAVSRELQRRRRRHMRKDENQTAISGH